MLFFFFKQKTAYEMRISDWSSDVCSSDLLGLGHRHAGNRIGHGWRNGPALADRDDTLHPQSRRLGVKLRPLARLCKRRGPRLVKRGIGLNHGKARPVDLVCALSHQSTDAPAAVLDLSEPVPKRVVWGTSMS